MTTILLVEPRDPPSADYARYLREIAPEAHVTVARSRAEAMRLLAAGSFDVIISDQKLGDGTGIDVLETSVQTQPRAKRMLIALDATLEIAIQALQRARIKRLMVNPPDQDTVRAHFRAILA